MEILGEGKGELVGWHDPDENRAWIRDNRPREMRDQRMDVAEAVRRFVSDGPCWPWGASGMSA